MHCVNKSPTRPQMVTSSCTRRRCTTTVRKDVECTVSRRKRRCRHDLENPSPSPSGEGGAKRRVRGRALHRTETLTKKSERSGRDMNLIFADALSIDRVAITMFVNVAPRNVDPIG